MFHLCTQFVGPLGEFPIVEDCGQTKTRGTQTSWSLTGHGRVVSVGVQTASITSPHQPLPKLAYCKQVLIVDKANTEGSSVFSSRLRGFALKDGKHQEDLYLVNLKYRQACYNVVRRLRNYTFVIRDLNNVIILKMLSYFLGTKMVITDADDKVIADVARKFMPPAYKVRSAIGLHLFTFRWDGQDCYKVESPDEMLLGNVYREEKLQGGGPPDQFFHPKLFVNFTNICDIRLRALVTCTAFYVVVCEEGRN